MTSIDRNFYVVRHDPSDTWQLCGRAGMPCMARSTLDAALRTAERLESVRVNKFGWPLQVMHVIDDDLPGQFNGWLHKDGRWTGKGTIFKEIYDIVMAGGEVGDAFRFTAEAIREAKGLK